MTHYKHMKANEDKYHIIVFGFLLVTEYILLVIFFCGIF